MAKQHSRALCTPRRAECNKLQKITLRPDSVTWQCVPIQKRVFRDVVKDLSMWSPQV